MTEALAVAAVLLLAAGAVWAAVAMRRLREAEQAAADADRGRTALLGQLAELDADRRLLRSVFAGMREGLLVVGPDRRIRLVNDAFRQIFDVPFDPVGRLLAEVLRDPRVVADLDAALTEGREIRDSVVRAADSGRSFELHVTPLAPGALVLLFDVSRLEALEHVRREFVANVSHELRTPLTSIKAFVETLMEGGLDDREHALRFLAIVRRHADRMNALIDDLTDLSLIETGSIALDLQMVDAGEVARDVVAQLAPRAPEVEVRSDVESPFPLLADRRRLEQVLVNLVDNAIKFNRPGGSVVVAGAVVDGHPVLSVEDTGVGVPADSLDKVFHRLYRVDRARSREAGGTGLGLAIVKHLMRLHGGSVRLHSELGKGSRFELEFHEPTGAG